MKPSPWSTGVPYDPSNVSITGGTIQGVRLASETLNTLTPAEDAAIVIDWSYGATKVTVDGSHTATFSNVASPGITSHVVDVSAFNSVTWPAAVDWGVLGKPSISGRAVVGMFTLDGGTKVCASVIWQAS